jgi:acetyl-CoA carboxylase carboxyl transferase subunit alpha
MARHPARPTSLDYISRFDRFDELHGDRHFRDDPSIVGGFALLNSRAVMVLGQQRGRDTKENLRRNFGMPAPEGYRKASRLARLAERLKLPIVTFIDTKGADPGISSEEHAQSEAIATCLQVFTTAQVPIVATVIGEGGSGGALALGIADRVLMLEHSTYSVASPEGCAAILWSDSGKAEEAAARLKLTADDLYRFGIVDEILPEPLGGAQRNAGEVVALTLATIDSALTRLSQLSPERLLDERYRKYRRVGEWHAESLEPIAGTR